MLVRLVAVMALGLTATQNPGTSLATFQNFNRTFQLELPEGWRQIAPNEGVQISEIENSPTLLRMAQPSHFYAVGPVEQWLTGNFDSPWLYVVEQRGEWYVEDEFEEMVRNHWREEGLRTGITHDVHSVERQKIGTQQVNCVVATRTSTAKNGRSDNWLDVHAPTGKQKLTLSLRCSKEQFDRWQPEFRRWLDTLTFARVPDEPATLGDRLWTPVLVGGAVGLVLLLLYRHTRARR